MKMWEAMLKGAKMKPQGFGAQFTSDGGSCAIGAVEDGLGRSFYWRFDFPALTEKVANATCPVSGCGYKERISLGSLCIPAHLNDVHRWSRECIAYWLKDIEEKLPQPVQEEASPKKEEPVLCGAG